MNSSLAHSPGWAGNDAGRVLQEAILSEVAFQRILVLERKRSERSGKPFVLVCVDVSRLRGETGQIDPVVRDTLFSTVLCSFRETDLVGWYSEHRVAAVLLTELGDGERDTVRSTIRQKVDRCILCRLPSELSGQVSVAVHYFPEDRVAGLPEEIQEVLYPDLTGRGKDRRAADALKRALDLAGSLAMLFILSPLLLLIAALIKLSSPGPVFFRQERVGRFGWPFQFLKFRSMDVNADSSLHEQYIEGFIGRRAGAGTSGDGGPIFKIVQDPRVTPIGRILRKTSLDELPQLFNVLKGQMSLVGPRPPIPYELKRYDLWHRRRILEVKPGITGLWQVRGRSRTTFDEMVRMDLHYAKHWNLWLDLRLLLETPLAVVRGDGAC
jgi:lipopolysaccharide/colanic/teichoic acid biosynthesis glycosyltransferase